MGALVTTKSGTSGGLSKIYEVQPLTCLLVQSTKSLNSEDDLISLTITCFTELYVHFILITLLLEIKIEHYLK